MNKKFLITIIIFWGLVGVGIFLWPQFVQKPIEKEIKTFKQKFGGEQTDRGYSVQQTTDGGFILTGSGTAVIGVGLEDLWLIKTDSQGNEEWKQTFGGMDGDWGYLVQQTTDGGFILIGNTASFGAGSFDFWLIKTDSQGNEKWSKTFGGEKADYGYSIQQTKDGGFILIGNTASFGVGATDLWLIKTDSQGNEEWSKTFGGEKMDFGYSVQQTTDGGFIMVGSTDSFGAGAGDLWLIKTDSQGNEKWSKTFGGEKIDYGYSIQETKDGGFILIGNTASFGAGSFDFWLIKTDSQGNEKWSKTFGGEKMDFGYSVQQTTDGGFILTGITDSFGASPEDDIWLIKTDSQGNKEWNRLFGGEGWDLAYSVQQTTDGGFILTGSTDSFMDATGIIRGGDIWLIKTDSSGNVKIEQ